MAAEKSPVPTKAPIRLFHPGLKDLLTLEKYCSDRLSFLSIEQPLPAWYKKFTTSLPSYGLGLHLRREYRHLAMAWQGFKNRDSETLFVFEAYNQHFLFLLPLLLISGKKSLVMLHGNQQFALTNKIKYLGLVYLKIFTQISNKIKVLILEVDDNILPEKVRFPDKSKKIIPHPIVTDLTPSLAIGERIPKNQKIKIGVVGIIRADKPIAKLVELLQNYAQSNAQVELIIGTPIKQKPNFLNNFSATFRDTTSEANYFQTLQEIDILVATYDRDRYYYRTSGVISDAGCAGCYVLASDYPLIEHQINYPVTIGATFNQLSELENKLDQAQEFIREKGQDNHWLWREARTAKAIAKLIFTDSELK